jgi:hypothetical protein
MTDAAVKDGFGDREGWLRAALADLEGSHEARLLHMCCALMRRLGLAAPRAGPRAGDVPAALRYSTSSSTV